MAITLTISGENAAEVQAQLRDAAATFSAQRTLEVATPAPVAAPAAPVEEEGEGEEFDINTPDARGYTWDAQIHSSNKKRVGKTNTWQYRRNVDQNLVKQVEAAQDALRAPVAEAVAAPAVVPPPPAPPVAEPTPEEIAAAFAAEVAPPPPPPAPVTAAVSTAELFKQAMGRVQTARAAGKAQAPEFNAAAIQCGATTGLPGLSNNHAAAVAFLQWLDGKGF